MSKHIIQQKISKYLGNDILKYITDLVNFGFWYFVSAGISLIIAIIVNKSLVPEELGRYSYQKSIIDLCASLVSINIYNAYLRFNTKGASVVLSSLTSKITKTGIIVLAIIIFIVTKSFIAIFYALFLIYSDRFYYARSLMDIKASNRIRMYSVCVTAIIIVLPFILKFNLNASYIFLAYGIGYGLMVLFKKSKYPKYDDTGELTYKTILLFALPGFGLVIVNWLINLSGQAMIKAYYGYVEVANFAIAQRTIAVIKLFSSLLIMFYPMVYYREIEQKNAKSLAILRTSMIILMLVVGGLAFIFSKQIYILLGAGKYIEYVHFFRLLVISEIIYTITSFYSAYLGFVIQTYKMLIVCSIGAIVNLGLLFLFLQKEGLIVAPVAILVSNIIMAIMLFCLSYPGERKYLKQA